MRFLFLFLSIFLISTLWSKTSNAQFSCYFYSSEYCQFIKACQTQYNRRTRLPFTLKSCNCQWSVVKDRLNTEELTVFVKITTAQSNGQKDKAMQAVGRMGFNSLAFFAKVTSIVKQAEHCAYQ